jgi:hypothetical protein
VVFIFMLRAAGCWYQCQWPVARGLASAAPVFWLLVVGYVVLGAFGYWFWFYV